MLRKTLVLITQIYLLSQQWGRIPLHKYTMLCDGNLLLLFVLISHSTKDVLVRISLLIHAMIFGGWILRGERAVLFNRHILSVYVSWQIPLKKVTGIYIPPNTGCVLISSVSPFLKVTNLFNQIGKYKNNATLLLTLKFPQLLMR